jgi:sporulation protein YlmC with PRC-barrel domain
MISRKFAVALLATTLMSGAAYAQNTNTNSNTNTAASSSSSNSGSMHQPGQWRASKLSGVNVYNENNEKIGDISDVILDKSGKAENVIIGVGGFLGMGEHLVAVPFDKIKWMNEPVRTSSASSAPGGGQANNTNAPATNVDSNARTAADGTTRTTTGTGTGTASTSSTSSTRSNADNWYPDHAVYNATKDQLKAMPQFKY